MLINLSQTVKAAERAVRRNGDADKLLTEMEGKIGGSSERYG